MSIVTHLFNATATKVSMKTNEFGELVHTNAAETSYPCRFRDFGGDALQQNVNMEQVTSDAQAWFEPSAPMSIGDILHINSEYWRIQTIQRARGAGSTVEFLKTFLERYRMVS